MATIKIPYTYTKFENAPFATKADKTVQKGTGLMLFAWGFVFIPLALAVAFAFADAPERSPLWVAATLGLILLSVILPILFPMIFRRIWNKKKLAYKIALLELKKNQSAKDKKAFRAVFVKIALAVIIPWCLMGCALLLKTAKPGQYSKQMHQAFAADNYAVAQGDLCTVYMVDTDTYSKELLPAKLVAGKPAQVRFILRVTEGTEQYGNTQAINPGTMKTELIPLYYRTYQIDWFDCRKGEVVKSEVHQGTKPLSNAPLENGGYYGNLPIASLLEYDLKRTYTELSRQ